MRAIWIGAIAISSALICAAFIAVPQEQPPDMAAAIPGLAEAKIVFIGSSLMRYGIPQKSEAEGLFEDGRHHSRLTMSRITEQQSTEFMRAAISAGNETAAKDRYVFIEIYPYIRTFRDEHLYGWTWGVTAPWEDRLRNFGRRIRGIKELALGGTRQRATKAKASVPNVTDLRLSYDGSRETFNKVYPELIHPPRDPQTLESALSEARSRGVRAVFVVLPRSQSVLDHLGATAKQEFTDAIAAFGRQFDVEVWSPALSWPDDHFKDRAHMNGLGRVRFIEALRARFGGPDERD
ncbi:hypothetical protein [Pelagibius sp. Alg239-R121]|uniref:hypothetical protein n=1 Tax=Pelagibius sp. Alg239-R121 TaxID=2993448 RepID=UPI0024A6AA31|nr:hypothetical protein [Pelagibius sp. Alg239-R121]